MNIGHNDIKKIVPYGAQINGFANQTFLSAPELHRILKERGIFTLNNDKDYVVPILQTLLISPKEFDKIRDAFSTKEDNYKVISRDIKWNKDINIFIPEILAVDVNDYIKRQLPTCELEHPIRFIQLDNNPNHLQAKFKIKRNDLNKSWYEQTNEFNGSIEFINENEGKGRVIIYHTAPETKELAENIVKQQIQRYKEKGSIENTEALRKITFSDFSNEERFIFFFRLTNHLECNYFKCENIKDISIKPEETLLPEEIKWMEEINKILLSGKSLDEKFFIKERKYHNVLIIWSMDSVFSYNYKNHKGHFTVNFGFPEYTSRKDKAEFELNILSMSTENNIDLRIKKDLKKQILSELDKLKSIAYNNFLVYKENKLNNVD